MARTKAGRVEVERRESQRGAVITELKLINDALGFVEMADDLSMNQIKITTAKQRTMLNVLIKKLEENQMPKRTLECGAGVEEDAKNKLALPDRC
jgi:hypothetical protein|tara:strand:+ start:535 stop:819 length:285 start_codon:yes stop_codon:yes gene_type:complete